MIPCNNVILHDCHKKLVQANLCYSSINKQECQKVRLFDTPAYLRERNSRWDAWKLNAEFAYSMIYGIKNEKHTKQYPKRANCDTMNPISKM